MPGRLATICICLFWLLMMGLLIQRDLLPQYMSTPVPVYQSAIPRGEIPDPVNWSITRDGKKIGWVHTKWERQADDWTKFESSFRVNELPDMLQALGILGQFKCTSTMHVTPEGKLEQFQVAADLAQTKIKVIGRVEGETMRVTFRSGGFKHDEQFFYDPRTLVTSTLTPLDKLPDLRLGKKWDYRVMSPLRKTTEVVHCEVLNEEVINWKGAPVPTFVVHQDYGGVTGRCWAAHDGTVLQQEIPQLDVLLIHD